MSKYLSFYWWKIALEQKVSRYYQSLGFKPKIIQKTVEGETFQFFVGDPTGKSWYDNANTTSLEMRSIRDLLLDRPMTIYECGAHHGLTTILLSRWVRDSAKIIAFECLPGNVDILRKNLDLNNCKNVTVIAKAVGTDGTVDIRQDSNSSVNTTQSKNSIRIESVSLDSFSKQTGPVPDLIKIDVEGFEIDVLENSREVLKTVPAIFVEVHSEVMERYKRISSDIWKYIDATHYDIWIQPDDKKPPFPYSQGEAFTTRVHLFFRPKTWSVTEPQIAYNEAR